MATTTSKPRFNRRRLNMSRFISLSSISRIFVTSGAGAGEIRGFGLAPRPRLAFEPFAGFDERLELPPPAAKVDLLPRQPHIVIERLRVAFPRIADQRHDRAFFAGGSHVGDQFEGSPEIGP